MKIVHVALRSLGDGLSRRLRQLSAVRNLSTNAALDSGFDDKERPNSSESADDFEHRIFGDISRTDSKSDSLFEKFGRFGKSRERIGSKLSREYNFQALEDGIDENSNTLSDGMDVTLKKAATYFEFDPEEIDTEDYTFRADMSFPRGTEYDIKDLDLTKPGVRRPPKRPEFDVTTAEVLRKADFRNVRFLENFITEAGIIIKRSKTGISAKAQRKVAREIKTARAFGLMPFTTMGTRPFVFGRTRESRDEDYEHEIIDNRAAADTLTDRMRHHES